MDYASPAGSRRTRNSCLRCQHRKIRCSRERPQCQNCLRLNRECQYETPRPANARLQPPTRTPGRAADELGASVDVHTRLRTLERTVAQLISIVPETAVMPLADSGLAGRAAPTKPKPQLDVGDVESTTVSGRLQNLLTVVDGEICYRTRSYWGQMVDDTSRHGQYRHRDGDCGSHRGPDEDTPAMVGGTASLSTLLFTPRDPAFDAAAYLPSRTEAACLFATFCERVDPVVRILHKPTIQRQMDDYMDGTKTTVATAIAADKQPAAGFEALLFAVFYAALYSLEEDDVSWTGPPRRAYLATFRYACIQSLLASQIFEKQSLESVSALFLLLFTEHHEVGVPSLYTLTGLLLRLARSMGLHIDPWVLVGHAPGRPLRRRTLPEHMTPIVMETRRRLWHQVLHLDLMMCEACGVDPEEAQHAAKRWPTGVATALPSNLNDAELSNDGEMVIPDALADDDGGRHTDMSTQLIRLSISSCFRTLLRLVPPHTARKRKHSSNGGSCDDCEDCNDDDDDNDNDNDGDGDGDGDGHDVAATACTAAIETMTAQNAWLHLRHCTEADTDPAQYLTRLMGRTAEHRAWLYYYVYWRGAITATNKQQWTESRRRALMHAATVQQLHHAALTDPVAAPFRWHIRRHSQLHATLHILNELCHVQPQALLLDANTRAVCQMAWDTVAGLHWSPPRGGSSSSSSSSSSSNRNSSSSNSSSKIDDDDTQSNLAVPYMNRSPNFQDVLRMLERLRMEAQRHWQAATGGDAADVDKDAYVDTRDTRGNRDGSGDMEGSRDSHSYEGAVLDEQALSLANTAASQLSMGGELGWNLPAWFGLDLEDENTLY